MAIQVNGSGFIYDDSGIWYPPLNIKQFEIFEDGHRYLLVHGPRKSGKTFGIIHKVLRHAFDTNGAMVAIVCKTIKNAKAAGVWVLLTRMLKIWSEQCPGFQIVEGPKTAGDSKMSFVRVRNRHGTISEIQCHSLEHSAEVEAKFKGPAYSMFWLSEFDQYCDEHAFDIFCDALRLWPNVTYEEHKIVADCNPPDTGTNNWIHDKWFKFKDEEPKEDENEDTHFLRSNLHKILVNLDDNPQLDPRERKDLETRYRRRKQLFARFIEGKWEMDITDGHFSDVWREGVHVVGNAEGQIDTWEVMVPGALCTELITGWDIGTSKNHSFHILEKILKEEDYEDANTKEKKKKMVVEFNAIDELVVVNKLISVQEFAINALEKMEHWEKYQMRANKLPIRWRHWSDTSAFEYQAASNKSDAAIVYEATNGRIALRGAPKYSGSNRDKVKLLWQLLYEERLKISAQLFKTKTMFCMLRKGDSVSEYVKRDQHKHPFDSLSYPIMSEAPTDMFRSADIQTTGVENSPHPVFARI